MASKSVLGKGLGSLLPGAGATYHPSKAPPPPPKEAKEVDDENNKIQAKTKEEAAAANANANPSTEVKKEETAEKPDGGIITSTNKDRIPGISMTTLDTIVENPFQPRREFDDNAIEDLAKSIKESGLIQPLVVRKTEKGYELIAGERRFRASKRAGLTQIPIVIRKTTDREMLELALIENIQREDLNCVEVAQAYFQLSQEFNLTQDEISKKVGKDRASVANYLRLLRLPEDVLGSLKKDEITFGHGKALMGLEDPPDRLKIWKRIVAENLSVRATEDAIQEIKDKKRTQMPSQSLKQEVAHAKTPVGARFRSIGRELTQAWGTRVQLKGNEAKGKFVVHYGSREELDRLIDRFQQAEK